MKAIILQGEPRPRELGDRLGPRRPRFKTLNRVRKDASHRADLSSRLRDKPLAALRPLGSPRRDQADYRNNDSDSTLHQRPTFRRILDLLVLQPLSRCICLRQRLRGILHWLLRQRR
jgi:hypothetical protein